jgi:peptidoglycan/LPS O-acetylase OafA/YrhL
MVGQLQRRAAVVLFFVISGFLITSLLIREERRNGRVSLKGFYTRRVFRIAPLYYLALAVTTVGAVGLGLGDGSAGFLGRLPLLATFNGDLASVGSFVHSWSIGVEEKFYIVWPALGFLVLALRRRRGLMLTFLLPLVVLAAYLPAVTYFGVYTGIVAGCALAVAMHTPRGYEGVQRLASPVIGNMLLVIAVLAFFFDSQFPLSEESGLAHVPFALAAALAFPVVLIGNGWVRRALSWRPLVFIGTRTYGIYLFHPLCIDIVGRVLSSGQTSAAPSLVRFALASVLSYVVAEVLFRVVEQRFTNTGKQISKRWTPSRGKPAVPAAR